MGKNYKEKSAYLYLHEISKISYNMLIKLRKKWNRHNFDVDEMRAQKKSKIERIIDKDLDNEINMLDDE